MIALNKKKALLKSSRLLFIIFLLLSNTFAWFIYATKVDNNISVHVKAWNVVFEAGDTQITNTINLNIDSVEFEYQINYYNNLYMNQKRKKDQIYHIIRSDS